MTENYPKIIDYDCNKPWIKQTLVLWESSQLVTKNLFPFTILPVSK